MEAPQSPMSHKEKIETIARCCHEANYAWCAAHGDDSQRPWGEAEDWQIESAIKEVDVALGGATSVEQHDAWCRDKYAEGWVHGEVKDPEAKMHPCLVPYEKLPAMQKAKDSLFGAIVRALAPTLELDDTHPWQSQ